MPNPPTPAEIKAARTRLGESQVAFAARLGVHPQTVAWWEQGKRTPTGLYLRELRTMLDAVNDLAEKGDSP